jgi:ribosomal protein L20A (L18A)
MQAYVVSGTVEKGVQRKFSLQLNAMSERHARALAKSILGSRHRLRSTAYSILEVKKG